jgi:WD40 repeat protein
MAHNRCFLTVFLAIVLFECGLARADEPNPPARVDQVGDPLPDGAFRRLGSARLRNGAGILTITYAPNGKWIASAGGTPWAQQGVTSGDRAVRVWDAESGKLVREFLDHDTGVSCLAFHPDGKRIAACTLSDGVIRLWNIEKQPGPGEERHVTIAVNQNGAPSMTFAFAPDGKTVAVSRGPQQEIVLIDIASRKERVFGTHSRPIDSLTFTPDGKFIASKAGNAVRLWDIDSGKVVRLFRPQQYHNKAKFLALETRTVALYSTAPAVFSRDGKILAAEGSDNTVYLWDVNTGKELRRLVHQGAVAAASLSPEGDRLVTGSHDNTLRIWDVGTGKELHHIEGHFGGYAITVFAPDGKSFASAGGDHSIRFWDPTTGKELRPTAGHRGELITAAYHPDGRSLVSVGRDNCIRIWDAKTGKELRHFFDDRDTIDLVALAPDGKQLATYSDDSEATRLWDIESGKLLSESPPVKITGMAFTRDGRSLVSCDQGGVLMQRDLKTWEASPLLKDKNIAAQQFALAPDGEKLALVGADGSVQIWDMKAGKSLQHFENVGLALISLAFSPDSSKLAGLAVGGHATVWSVPQGRILYQMQKAAPNPFTNPIGSLSFSPDGRTLAVTGAGNTAAVLWDLHTGTERIAFSGHRGPLTFVAYAPDGRSVVSGSWDTTMLMWDIYGTHEAPPRELPERELEAAWTDLTDQDAAKAFRATRKLLSAPGQAGALLSRQLKPVPPVSKDHIARLIKDLDSNSFDVRQKAFDNLDRLGAAAEKALRQALATDLPLEVRRRVEQLLEKLREGGPQGDHLQTSRALEILEQLGTRDARGVLEKLAQGEPEAPLTRDAKETLARLGRR